MLEKQTTFALKQLLDTVSECEMLVERHRQELCTDGQFETYTAFCRLDYGNVQLINSHNLAQFFKENRVTGISVGECARVIRQFDSDKDGFLTLEDFQNLVLTSQNQSLRKEVLRRSHCRVARFERLPAHIESLVLTILEHEIDLLKRVEFQLRDLKFRPDFTIQRAFQAIDRHGESFINCENLDDFFKQNGI